MAVTWLDPVILSLDSTLSTWVDVDVSAYVPAGATGVILHLAGASSAPTLGIRKKGSTDARFGKFNTTTTHMWAAIGIDGNRVFQTWRSRTDARIRLVGYTSDEAVFFDNGTEITPSSINTWTDADISAATGSNTALGVIVEIKNTITTSYNFGVRKKGSTDEYYYLIIENGITWAFIGVDELETLQAKVGNLGVKVFVLGYFTKDVVFNTNAADHSLTAKGAYYDLTALPTGATGGFLQVCGPTQTRTYAIRKNGSTETVYGYVSRMCWAAVECDEDGLLEGRIDSTAGKFYLTGYTTAGEESPLGIMFATFI